MKPLLSAFCAAALTIAVFASDAAAQATSAPAFPAIFGGTVGRGGSSAMDATVSVLGAYEDNGDDNELVGSLFETTGFYSAVSGTFGYQLQKKNISFGANLGTEGRYYRELKDFVGTNNYAGVGFEVNFARRTSIAVNQTLSLSPAYFTGLFPTYGPTSPGAVLSRGADYATSDLNALSYETSGVLTHGVSRGGTLSLVSSLRQTEFDAATGYNDLRSYSAGGRYLHRVSRNASLRLGYVFRQGQYALLAHGAKVSVHDIDAGVDYGRALSLFRRTRLEFGVGSAIVKTPSIEGQPNNLRYEVLGNAAVNHEISRTWRARMAFTRGLGFVDGLPEPVFTDGIAGSVGGFVNTRVELQTSFGYTNGDVGSAGQQGNTVSAYTGAVRMQIGLARMFALSSEYLYYRYDIGSAVQLPAGVPLFRARNAVRAGLTMWLPLLRK